MNTHTLSAALVTNRAPLNFRRAGAWLLGVLLLGAAWNRAPAADEPFDFETLRYRARMLAAKPYVAPASRVPEWLLKLSYDEHRRIRFDPAHSWWRRERLPFELQFFHPGFIIKNTVQISEIRRGEPTLIKFDPELFIYDRLERGEIPGTMGFAGFKILYPMNKPGDELGAFQGASYFRLLCQKAIYGLSARGLALNTAEPGGEEFPTFTDFWIERPEPHAKSITLYALLDSPSVAGAYRFVITPGADTVAHVKAALFFRKQVTTVGLAPLTSMFWHGENTNTQTDDFRPEVHDSDGLMLFTGAGEWLWRPVTNPTAVRVAAFSDERPRGFGLLQRDRNFENYQDLEAAYHSRPSAWVEPIGNWGAGSVRLVEIPTPDETNDNIVAFWTPRDVPPVGEPLVYEYRLHWFTEQIHPPAGYTVSTRHGRTKTHEPELERFHLDFAGPYLNNQSADPAIEPVVTVGDGAKLAHATVQKNPFNGTWRVAFAIRPDGSGRPVELRCFLRKSPHVLTETWSYLWQP
ncbi:glucan biosynthesis protein [Opitutus terrae]|uniref:Glucans biosynthesis protein G n=1 Tax=Opitutus terrae (strain DSM 11246 / JCM 15787 / PB90-1) TaxID=452637 RepID=B1ZZ65_OPITP|nr:glucan biosynthesis protein [Opitutus terrae]ACB77137.1 periplasmic glucan biosynthesis protein MdoG [Opitutus terrae PB90-1]